MLESLRMFLVFFKRSFHDPSFTIDNIVPLFIFLPLYFIIKECASFNLYYRKEDTGDKKSLITFLDEKSRFTSRGFDYSVIAILGPQSSGKSMYLLLLLYGKQGFRHHSTLSHDLDRHSAESFIWDKVWRDGCPEWAAADDPRCVDGRLSRRRARHPRHGRRGHWRQGEGRGWCMCSSLLLVFFYFIHYFI